MKIHVLYMPPHLHQQIWACAPALRFGARLCVGLSVAFFFQASAHAATETHANPWLDLLYQAINLITLLALIYFFARRPLTQLLQNKAQQAQQHFQQAFLENEQAAAALRAERELDAQWENKMNQMRTEAHVRQENEVQRIAAQAQAQAERITTQAQQLGESEMLLAHATLRQELGATAVRLATQRLERDLTTEQRAQWASVSLERIANTPSMSSTAKTNAP